MGKNRLEAFSDGVIAILITIEQAPVWCQPLVLGKSRWDCIDSNNMKGWA
jgi:hypothetical protein